MANLLHLHQGELEHDTIPDSNREMNKAKALQGESSGGTAEVGSDGKTNLLDLPELYLFIPSSMTSLDNPKCIFPLRREILSCPTNFAFIFSITAFTCRIASSASSYSPFHALRNTFPSLCSSKTWNARC